MLTDPRQCAICRRRARVAYNRPHSLHRTKRLVRLNLQKYQAMLVCNRCRKTLTRRARIV